MERRSNVRSVRVVLKQIIISLLKHGVSNTMIAYFLSVELVESIGVLIYTEQEEHSRLVVVDPLFVKNFSSDDTTDAGRNKLRIFTIKHPRIRIRIT